MSKWDKPIGITYQILGATFFLVGAAALFFVRFDIMFFCALFGLGLGIYGTNKLRVSNGNNNRA